MTSNPFSTCFTRPGAIPFIYPEDQSANWLIERLRANRWRGQIIGPHGSGKSTLLAALLPELIAAGRQVISITLRQGERKLPTLDSAAIASETQLVIDGYEQLSWWSRFQARRLCGRTGAGLLVTAHGPVGLPPLFETAPSMAVARQVVQQLLDGDSECTSADGPISVDDVKRAFDSAAGNVRETLFKLYDLYQSRRH